MINRIIKYVHYLLALLLLILIVLGKDLIAFLVGGSIIYVVLYTIKLISLQKVRTNDPASSPYKTLISVAKPKDNTTTPSVTDSESEDESIKPDPALEDMEVDDEFDENYDPESDTYDYAFETGTNTEGKKEENTKMSVDSVNLEYRKSKLERLLGLSSKIPRMGGIEFEEFLRDLYDVLGYIVHKTDINDQGADLIVVHQNEKIVIQAKRYKNKVSNSAIQQVYTAKAFYDCDKAIVITNSEFTKSAREVAEKVGVELWDSKSLQSMLSSMKTMFNRH